MDSPDASDNQDWRPSLSLVIIRRQLELNDSPSGLYRDKKKGGENLEKSEKFKQLHCKFWRKFINRTTVPVQHIVVYPRYIGTPQRGVQIQVCVAWFPPVTWQPTLFTSTSATAFDCFFPGQWQALWSTWAGPALWRPPPSATLQWSWRQNPLQPTFHFAPPVPLPQLLWLRMAVSSFHMPPQRHPPKG